MKEWLKIGLGSERWCGEANVERSVSHEGVAVCEYMSQMGWLEGEKDLRLLSALSTSLLLGGTIGDGVMEEVVLGKLNGQESYSGELYTPASLEYTAAEYAADL